MTGKVCPALALSAMVLLMACTTRAEEDEPMMPGRASSNARKVVARYLDAEAKDDYRAMEDLFANDARVTYHYKWGHGYEDSVYVLDLSKDDAFDSAFEDDAYKRFMKDYQVRERSQRIKNARSMGDCATVVEALVTEKYTYQRYRGSSRTALKITITASDGAPKISRLHSTTEF